MQDLVVVGAVVGKNVIVEVGAGISTTTWRVGVVVEITPTVVGLAWVIAGVDMTAVSNTALLHLEISIASSRMVHKKRKKLRLDKDTLWFLTVLL